MKPREAEQMIKSDGWHEVRSSNGSHKQYKHQPKRGKSPYRSIPETCPREHCTASKSKRG